MFAFTPTEQVSLAPEYQKESRGRSKFPKNCRGDRVPSKLTVISLFPCIEKQPWKTVLSSRVNRPSRISRKDPEDAQNDENKPNTITNQGNLQGLSCSFCCNMGIGQFHLVIPRPPEPRWAYLSASLRCFEGQSERSQSDPLEPTLDMATPGQHRSQVSCVLSPSEIVARRCFWHIKKRLVGCPLNLQRGTQPQQETYPLPCGSKIQQHPRVTAFEEMEADELPVLSSAICLARSHGRTKSELDSVRMPNGFAFQNSNGIRHTVPAKTRVAVQVREPTQIVVCLWLPFKAFSQDNRNTASILYMSEVNSALTSWKFCSACTILHPPCW